jgi:nucleotide-binding universal stress UspA family protein
MPGDRFRHIAVALDGSADGSRALDVAIDLVGRYGSELVVLAVAPLGPVYVATAEPYVPPSLPDVEQPRYREIVDAGVRQAQAAGLTAVTGVCLEGVINDELLSYLGKHPVDLLVVGSRGRSAARRILLGSVSTAMVTHAPCPVLVVRPPPTPSGGPS